MPRCVGYRTPVRGKLGFDKAEVTLGGVDTDHLSSRTMEARTVPGLHFIGEVVDVTGHLGGLQLPAGVGERPRRGSGHQPCFAMIFP